MIYKMYSNKDELSGFLPPIPFTNEEMAKRYFKTLMETNTDMLHNPEDFNLYYLGTYDTESGTFIMDKTEPQRIAKGVDYVKGKI